MGKRHEYKCSSCGYKVMTAAGPSRGFNIRTDTFVCTSCKIVQDLCIGSVEKPAIPMIHHTAKEVTPACRECKSGEHLVKWDTVKLSCPQCSSAMMIKNEKIVMMWD